MATARKNAKRKSKSVSKLRKTGTTWVMAVDPFGGVDLEPMWHLVKPLSERFHAKVQAAFVLAPSGFNWTGDFSGAWMKRYLPIAAERVAATLPDKNLPKEV